MLKLFGRRISPPEKKFEVHAVDFATEEIEESVMENPSSDPDRMEEEEEEEEQDEMDSSSAASVDNDEDDGTKKKPSTAKKPLTKPDKILPCPRCNSSNTKFCYYNNYNVNQPRHFCKNCQRYWTAGGTMRNVPVGAGRRKNKSAAANRRQPPSTVDEPEPADVTDNGYTWPVAWPVAAPPFFFWAAAAAAPPERKSSVWVPKTLRIDDPDEAAKSSIWATLGISPDPKICNGGIFRGFDKGHVEGGQVSHVNPAAMSRSQAFKESS